jgi:hypothetical protein
VRLLRAIALAAVLAAAAACSSGPVRHDHGLEQASRARVVQAIANGDTGVDGPVREILSRKPLVVFFRTWVASAPDPNCGYEYAEDPSSLNPDPYGSGHGQTHDIGDGWYWLCAQ